MAEEVVAMARRKSTAYKKDELNLVGTFRYLGRIIARGDSDMPATRHNLKRTCQVWGGFPRSSTRRRYSWISYGLK